MKADLQELVSLTNDNLASLDESTTNNQPRIDETDDDDPFAREYALFKVRPVQFSISSYN